MTYFPLRQTTCFFIPLVAPCKPLLDLYKNKREVPGLSVMKRVTWKNEWLAEAYMETDYSTLSESDFQKTINDYLAYLVKEGHVYEA